MNPQDDNNGDDSSKGTDQDSKPNEGQEHNQSDMPKGDSPMGGSDAPAAGGQGMDEKSEGDAPATGGMGDDNKDKEKGDNQSE